MTDAYIIDAVRTPRGIGKPGKGALSHLHPQHLAATVLAALRDRNHLDTADVDAEGSAGRRSWPDGDSGGGLRHEGERHHPRPFLRWGIITVNLAAASVMA